MKCKGEPGLIDQLTSRNIQSTSHLFVVRRGQIDFGQKNTLVGKLAIHD